MNIKDLKVGDLVYIREDLEVYKKYGSARFAENMKQGVQRIMSIDSAEEDFNIASEADSFRYHYTPEMIDWDKTIHLRCMENLSGMHEEEDKVNSPSHYKLEGLDIESVDVIKSVLGKEKFIGWVWGNSLKYLLRQEKKNGIEDVKKAMKNLEWLVEMLEKEE